MALIEFGSPKKQKAVLTRIRAALRQIEAEQESLRLVVTIARGEETPVSAILSELRSAHVRTFGYIAIAMENVLEGLGQGHLFNLRPYYAPTDTEDEMMPVFLGSVAKHLYGTKLNELTPRLVVEPHDVTETYNEYLETANAIDRTGS